MNTSLQNFDQQEIENRIFTIRDVQVMLDGHLAEMYGVDTKVLNQAVKRNVDRFPESFRFQLTEVELSNSRSQFVTLKQGQNIKYLPMAFTAQGVAMLSSALNSKHAISVNIQIMRLFTKLRIIAADTTELKLEIEQIKKKISN